MRSQRVLLDTNIYISYLLRPAPDGPFFSVIALALRGDFLLLLPEELVPEMLSAIRTKPYLRQRIAFERAEELVALLLSVAMPVNPDPTAIPLVVRDPADNYLLAAAVAGDADYLVTGDKDLLVLRDHLDRPRIVTTAEFVRELSKDG